MELSKTQKRKERIKKSTLTRFDRAGERKTDINSYMRNLISWEIKLRIAEKQNAGKEEIKKIYENINTFTLALRSAKRRTIKRQDNVMNRI